MLLNIFNSLFIFSGILFVILVILHKIHFSKMKDNVKLSHYVAAIVLSLFVYIICALAIAIISNNNITKATMIISALLPFVIGKVATYEKEKFYTTLQIFCIILSMLSI